MGGPRIQHPRKYDDAKLSQMVAPFTVRIEKISGSSRTPIPIPPSDDGKPGGTEWDMDDVRGLEDWLVTEWAGGGLYEISVTDSTVPTPIVMTWQPFWKIADYPEKTPPPLLAARSQYEQRQQIQQPQPQVSRMSAFPGGLPPGAYPQQPTQYPIQAPTYYQPLPPPPPIGSQSWPAYQAEEQRRRVEEDNARLREQASLREREASEARHKAELDRERQANEQRFQQQANQLNELRTMISGLTTNLTQALQQAQTAGKPSEADELRRQMERDRTERDAKDRDQAMREMMRQMQDNHQAQVVELRRQMEIMMASARDQGNQINPILTLVQQLQRDSAETVKEIARASASQIDKLQPLMMSPRDMFAMAKDANAGVENATERMGKFFGTVVEMQQRVAENMLSLQPQSSGVIDLVRDGISTIKDTAERYVGAKSASERVQVQAQVQMAQAQAEAMKAAAAVETARATGAVVTPPPPVQAQIPAQAGLNGPIVRPTKAKNGKSNGKHVEAPGTVKHLGRTDMEWFGPLIGEVEQARLGAMEFLESCRQTPPRMNSDGEIQGTNPEELAGFVVQAAATVMQMQLPIPALLELLMQERFADFVDVLVPDATQPYRDDVVKSLIEQIRALTGHTPGEVPADDLEDDSDPEGDEDDDGEEHEGNGQAKPVHRAQTKKVAPPAQA